MHKPLYVTNGSKSKCTSRLNGLDKVPLTQLEESKKYLYFHSKSYSLSKGQLKRGIIIALFCGCAPQQEGGSLVKRGQTVGPAWRELGLVPLDLWRPCY